MSSAPWFRQVQVPADLSEDLVTGWLARTDSAKDLVPDGCVDVMWTGDDEIWLCGPETSGWTFTLPAGTEGVGLRFRPGRAASLLGIDAAEVSNQRLSVRDVLGSDAERDLVDRVIDADSSPTRMGHMQAWVRKRLASAGADDPTADMVVRLLNRDITSGVHRLATAAGVSPRQLHRRCTLRFGYGPATLRGILRMQRFLRLARHPTAPHELALLAHAAGYADQQHLCRDCRRIARMTPRVSCSDGRCRTPMSDPSKTRSRVETDPRRHG